MKSGASASPIVKLNVGGTKFLSTEQTLSRGDNFFTGLLSGKIPSVKDEDGFFFIDRDGRVFGVLLEFLRTGRLRLGPGVDEQDVLVEASFYSINLHAFSPLSDAALCRWLDAKQSNANAKQWSKYPELGELRERVLDAFRHEQQHGEGVFQFCFYPEMSEFGSVSKFISKLIAEDEVSPEHRKAVESCKSLLLKCDFAKHPYYPVPQAAWKVLGLPQCQTLLQQHVYTNCGLSIEFKMSRIGLARVEKRQEVDGNSLYMVHDFYALMGLDNPRSLTWHEQGGMLRQQFDRCVSAVQVVWSHNKNNSVKSPKLSSIRQQDDAF